MEAAALPTGFVTLLMSDIEGSTGLLRKLGDRYGALLNDVRGILRAAVSGSGGREIDARADEFFAVFERAGAAVEAAVAVQRDLAARHWTDGLQVRLRIGIHSGHPTLTEAGYIGLAVHTTARVCAAAHGRQIVVSAATRAAIGTSPPAGVRSAAWGAIACPAFRTRRCSSRCRLPGCTPASRRRERRAAHRSARRPPSVTTAPNVSSSCPSRPREASRFAEGALGSGIGGARA
jgi:class 3 adenylate cyclase